MFKEPTGFESKSFFLEGLNHSSLLHNGRTPLCMQYLRKGGGEVSAEEGLWRLWEAPADVPRAADVRAMEQQMNPEAQSLRRLQGDIDRALATRKESLDDKVNRPLTPSRSSTARQRSKSNRGERKGKGHSKGYGKAEGKGDQATSEYGKGKLMEPRCKAAAAPEARSKAGPPVGSGASSSGNPFRQEVRSTVGMPISPEAIERQAATYWQRYESLMKRNDVEYFPNTLVYYDRKLHFMLHEFVKGLVFEPEEYAPILHVLANGGLKYEKVTAYDQKWLP